MPNWCYGWVEVEGKKKDVENFCKLFIFDAQIGKKRKPYFARSFANNSWKSFKKEHLTINKIIENFEGKNAKRKVSFGIDFAWSVWSCLIEGYPEKFKSVTLQKACKKYKVDVTIESEEGGIGFEERIFCSNKGKLDYKCIDMITYKCKCGNREMIASSHELEDYECCECGKCGKWKVAK